MQRQLLSWHFESSLTFRYHTQLVLLIAKAEFGLLGKGKGKGFHGIHKVGLRADL